MAEIPPTSVQDMLGNAGRLPEIFTRNEASSYNPLLERDSADNGDLPWMDCPIIDFSLLSSPSDNEQELNKLYSALVSWGSFQLINHGMTETFLDEVRHASKEFFHLPKDERMKFLRAPNNPEGYGNDSVLSQNVPHNWNDRLYFTVYPEDRRKLDLWPQSPPNFRGMLEEFSMKVKELNENLVKAMAKTLGLEERSFIDEYGDQVHISTRINMYPQCPVPELVHASRPHSDGSAMTFLIQDPQVEGLQVFQDDKWFKVPAIPHALFVNVGDQMEILSNGIFKAAVHKVVANSERERLTVVMFCSPDPEKEIGPLKKLVNENQPPLYKTIKGYAKIFFQYHPNGKRPIQAVKI